MTPRTTLPARGDDPIYWAPPDVRGTVVRMNEMGVAFLHRCPKARIVTLTSRDSLDPMALGTCRYCHQPLPVPETNA